MPATTSEAATLESLEHNAEEIAQKRDTYKAQLRDARSQPVPPPPARFSIHPGADKVP
jgi:hypothetical protein